MTLQSKHRHEKKGQEWIMVGLLLLFLVASGSCVIPPLLCLSATCEATLLRHSPTETGSVFVLVGGSTSAGATAPVLRGHLDKQNWYVLGQLTSQALIVSPITILTKSCLILIATTGCRQF